MKHPSSQKRLGSVMITLAWILVLGLLTVAFNGWLDEQHNPNQRVDGEILDDGVRKVVLLQNRGGHYVANGTINDHSVQFLLDTGATDVSVPADLANALRLNVGPARPVQTANGTITTYATTLDQVALGSIILRNVRAHINPRMGGDEVLLGMSFLRQLEFTQRGNSLTLRQYPTGT